MLSLCVIVFCMPLRCAVLSFLCDVVCFFVCLCYGSYLLFAYRFHWFVLCAVVLVSCLFVFLVCMCCLWCVVLLFVVSLVCRACMCCCCVVFVIDLLWFE